MNNIYIGLVYILLAPLLGGLLMGLDRIVSARMQRRKGPPLFQPFYDVAKLFQKETIVVNRLQNPALNCHLFFMMATGFLFFEGSDILLIIFLLTLSAVFLVLAAYASASPFSHIGAERELILMTAYEPMVLLTLIGFYKVVHSFSFYTIAGSGIPLILYLPGIFLGFLFILTMKFRKSPFDISVSEHAHQELVSGLTADFSGRSIAKITIARWYEDVFLLGIVFLFFSFNIPLAIIAVLLTYLLEVLIDNTYARYKWEYALRSAWLVALLLGGGNLIFLYAFMGV